MKRSELKEAIKSEIKSVLSENMNLSEIKDQGLIDGINAITRDINMFGPPKLKSVVEIQTYVEAFGDGVEEEGRRISGNMKAAMRGGGDESVLSENVNPAFDKKIASFAKKINNEMGYQGGVLEAMKQIKSRLERIISKVEDAKRGGAEEEPLMKMIGLKEEDEPTAADLKKADSVASAANKLQKLVKKMKDKAKDFKAAEGEAKEKIKDELKKMTAEKKKLEKSI